MKIGMVSKPEHCKPHIKALEDRGHEVVCLGTDKPEFGSSFDVFVCRPDSVSHQAFWDASAMKKDGREVIFENSVTKIVKAIQKIEEEVRRESAEYTREASRVASVLQDALEPNPVTVEKKLLAAIKEVGIYHPRLEITSEQLQTLQDYGLIKSLPRAKDAYHMASIINPTSWQRPFNNIRRSTNFYTYRMWKLSDTEGRMKMKTPLDLAAPAHIPVKTLEKVAKLFGLSTVEPTEGRVWPPNMAGVDVPEPAPLPQSPVMQAAADGVMEEEKMQPQLYAAIDDGLAAMAAEPPVARKKETTAAKPEIPAPVVEKTKPEPKKDIKDLLSMINDALLALNVASLTIKPGSGGPEYEMEQRVIRKVTSIDDLE